VFTFVSKYKLFLSGGSELFVAGCRYGLSHKIDFCVLICWRSDRVEGHGHGCQCLLFVVSTVPLFARSTADLSRCS
jgi:hypothetical protein